MAFSISFLRLDGKLEKLQYIAFDAFCSGIMVKSNVDYAVTLRTFLIFETMI